MKRDDSYRLTQCIFPEKLTGGNSDDARLTLADAGDAGTHDIRTDPDASSRLPYRLTLKIFVAIRRHRRIGTILGCAPPIWRSDRRGAAAPPADAERP
ncbi:hypothetical protein [Burkholderia glumae]|uniref:hypothetical protein n=1 Tax=Burkholderia glumae TaxID=337 RepID=UPI002151CC96|nr:hypothetical protein [Burkholderia glumae]